MDLTDRVRAFDHLQQRRRWTAFPLAVIKKFADDQGGDLAALIAYRAFFSLFPLLLLLTTVLGFVLAGDRSAQNSVIHSALGQFPVIGDQIKVHSLRGSGLALAVGIVGSLWAGLGVVLATQSALDRVWAVPFRERHDFLRSRLRALMLLALLGALSLSSTVASGLVAGGLGGVGLKSTGIATSVLLNVLVFLAAFRLLSPEAVRTHDLLPGIIIGALAWEVLQAIGGYYVGHVVRKASPVYGTFALVIGLLAWIHVGALITVYAAEANVVKLRRLWPRSLLGIQRLEDERTLRDLARVEERDERETVRVRFWRRNR